MDILGNTIEVGNRIIYPVRNGSTVCIQTGVVEQMLCGCGMLLNVSGYITCGDTAPDYAKVRKASGKLVTLTSFGNVVVVK